MADETPNYRREFAGSAFHLWWGLATVGAGFISATPLGLILGLAVYGLGWIYLPDLPLFHRFVDRRLEAARRAAMEKAAADFIRRRDAQIESLTLHRRTRYKDLALVCESIAVATMENTPNPTDAALATRLRKLEELMWTFLRMLGIEQGLELFLETESKDDVTRLTREAEAECNRLGAEIDQLKAAGQKTVAETRQRLLSSRLERLDVLRKRLQRAQQARETLDLVVAEQDRLTQQIKLIRADAVATRNAEALTARIDATVEHLDQTNRWLAEINEFKDVVGDMPPPETRIGFGTLSTPPPLAEETRPLRPPKLKAKDS
jgi:hypothetical protein